MSPIPPSSSSSPPSPPPLPPTLFNIDSACPSTFPLPQGKARMAPTVKRVYRCISACPHAQALNAYPPFNNYGPIAVLLVGESRQEFPVHSGLICHHSTFFRAAFEGGFIESKTRVCQLPDEDPVIVEAFLNWLYTRRVTTLSVKEYGDSAKLLEEYMHLFDLCIFADARGVAALQNAAMDALFELAAYTWQFPFAVVGFVYENTAPRSVIRRFMVDLVLRTRRDLDAVKRLDVVAQTPEFLEDLDSAAAKLVPIRSVRTRMEFNVVDRCAYHVHPKARDKRPF